MTTTFQRYTRDGILAALISAALLGLAPIFGKQALRAGIDFRTLVLLRTVLAAIILWVAFFIFQRKFFFIYPVGFIACTIAGVINGIGSLFYYSGLNRLDASVAQLIYSINPIILILLLRLDGQPVSRLTVLRVMLAFPAIYLLTFTSDHEAQVKGVLYMLIGAMGYALHLAIIQRTLRDMPPQTVTLYTLSAMALTVAPFGMWSVWTHEQPKVIPDSAWLGVAGLTVVTILSRLSLSIGVKKLGGLQAALLGLSELIVSVFSALIFFGERLSPVQWIGAWILGISIGLVNREKDLFAHYLSYGWLAWMYGLFERIHPTPEGLPTAKTRPKKAMADKP